ncbi:nuclear transport factor 2 family protein [uncultured Winogradskyella sp.]|uniref:nuclear transport factor 2 family protein n=1 Tax=uncultured Winogradskyella sp. TaxID=395353 RepID=UPI0026228379|nr:nuclear transport factor 2 family protein [uncultured Winogradskyella sp.]|tara:strand:+ start:1253 stop:2701 length:1449 start_codon:yes stop_codon:yes gene_type:complete
MKIKLIALVILGLFVGSCSNAKSVLEVTTFKTKSVTNTPVFNKLDAEIEANFTKKQPGFIKRQSGINENGEYVVLVYWETLENAKASMEKFMSDASVADYASMIEGASMKMSRYIIDDKFKATNSNFVEVMSFETKEGIDMNTFNKINKRVEKGFTSKQEGFLQRITGVNENGEQIVAVYWDNKGHSDAALQPFMNNNISKEFMGMMNQSSIWMGRYQTLNSLKNNGAKLSKKDKVVALLNSFNTGDKTPISYINPNKYIQHNLGVADGLAGFGAVMQHAPPGGFKANVIRAFEDGEYVFTQTEYDFYGPKVGFDVFRFEDGLIVEHWDNLLEIQKPNPSGHTQFDGATEVSDLEKTEANKNTVSQFLEKVVINHEMDKLTTYINPEKYIQHNPAIADGLEGFGAAMQYFVENGLVMEFTKVHKVLGQGNFVLAMSEGKFGKGEHTAFYDLFRLENGQIVEHWDVIAPIPAESEWKNTNGKF